MNSLKVDPDVAFDTSRLVSNEAVELHEQLAGLQRDWDNLARGWSGTASSTYSPLWEEWLEGATTLVDALDELAQNVAACAAEYAEQDAASGVSIASTPIDPRL